MKIKVTAEHINKGEPMNHSSCPIALAINDVGYFQTNVGPNLVIFRPFMDSIQRFKVSLPTRARKFIEKFDAKKTVKPFNFIINFDRA